MAQSTPIRPVVLIVEDEPLLRIDAADIIENAGFEVLEAGNAREALDILNARSDIRIVFTDVSMPGSLDGLRLALAIRERWPPIELIITSGQIVPGENDIPTRGRFLAKPFEPEHLVATLRSFVQ